MSLALVTLALPGRPPCTALWGAICTGSSVELPGPGQASSCLSEPGGLGLFKFLSSSRPSLSPFIPPPNAHRETDIHEASTLRQEELWLLCILYPQSLTTPTKGGVGAPCHRGGLGLLQGVCNPGLGRPFDLSVESGHFGDGKGIQLKIMVGWHTGTVSHQGHRSLFLCPFPGLLRLTIHVHPSECPG